VSLWGFFIVVLVVLLGVALAYDLKARRRRRGLPGESSKARRQGVGRVEQDRRTDTRVRPETSETQTASASAAETSESTGRRSRCPRFSLRSALSCWWELRPSASPSF